MNGTLSRVARAGRGSAVTAPGRRAGPLEPLEARLRFALDRNGVDLGLLAALFKVTAPGEIASIVRATPAGAFARRLWFLYEWLTHQRLDVPELTGRLRFVPVLDPARQAALKAGTPSARHRVIDNLPGTRRFCPMVRWTPALRAASARGWDARARGIVTGTDPDRRPSVAAWLQRSDARASFVLAGERPSGVRAERWADALGQAGARVLSPEELLRLQRVVCGGTSANRLGLRSGPPAAPFDSGGRPGPGAPAADLHGLLAGMIDYVERAVCGGVDPVIAAAAVAFGFAYIRPFITGNGHLHRWLVHHVIGAAGYAPPGVVLPIVTAMVRRRDDYREVFRSYSLAPCPSTRWQAACRPGDGAFGDEADAYRFVEMTTHAEFLYRCLEDSIEQDLLHGAAMVPGRAAAPAAPRQSVVVVPFSRDRAAALRR